MFAILHHFIGANNVLLQIESYLSNLFLGDREANSSHLEESFLVPLVSCVFIVLIKKIMPFGSNRMSQCKNAAVYLVCKPEQE
jgi:hypothetical protein